MKSLCHLQIEEVKLPPGQEWMDPTGVWRFLLVSRGAAYWMGEGRARSLAQGEMLILSPAAKGIVRASQLNEVSLYGFSFAPDLLYGFFTLTERHFFETDTVRLSKKIEFLPSTHPVTQQFASIVAGGDKAKGLAQRTEVLSLVAAVFGEKTAIHRPPPTLGTSALHRFERIIAKMPDMEIINHPLEQLARLCGCSSRHFNRLFRRHFGTSLRARQTELRLLKSRQLLCSTGEKIINVALECGYRNLSLFNSLFKKRFGMTPSDCRRKAAKKSGKTGRVAAKLAVLLLGLASTLIAAETKADSEPIRRAREAVRRKMILTDIQEKRNKVLGTNTVSGLSAKTNAVTFEVKDYELVGNTLLPPDVTQPILLQHIGPAVSFDEIREARKDIQMAYRDRGFVTVAVNVPQQQLTNGVVKFQVIEGRLAEITVRGNRYFSSNNVMRALPNLRTNELLNSLVLQQELDRANANRDRQIYPVLSPGFEPATSALELKVKDRLPLHARFELNNNATPNSPELRMNLAAQYNNLWQLDHQFGVQYSFTPEEMKEGGYNLYEQPLIANYSAFYRMPLSGVNGPPRQSDYSIGNFGYDEATHRFRPPPPTGAAELMFYVSRSVSDTGMQLQQETDTQSAPSSAGVYYVTSDQIYSETLNPNEDIGMRLIKPLPRFLGWDSTLSLGIDFKNWRNTLSQVEVLAATLWVPPYAGAPPEPLPSLPLFIPRKVFTSVQYLPLSISLNASRADKFGATVLDLGSSFQFVNVLSSADDFRQATGNTNSTGRYIVFTAGLTREQKIFGDWGVRFHADGQWANQRLVSNEQFGLGGQAGPRGYHEGELYGDTGWRVQCEPHSPYLNLGLVDGTVPLLVRLYAFVDYGQCRLLDSGFDLGSSGASTQRMGRDSTTSGGGSTIVIVSGGGSQSGTVTLASTGFGFNASIGEHFDFRFQLGVALHDTPVSSKATSPSPLVRSGDVRATFGIGIQF